MNSSSSVDSLHARRLALTHETCPSKDHWVWKLRLRPSDFSKEVRQTNQRRCDRLQCYSPRGQSIQVASMI